MGDGPGDTGVIKLFGSVPESLERIDMFDPPDLVNNGKPTGKTMISAGPSAACASVHWQNSVNIQEFNNYDAASSLWTGEPGS